MQAQSKSPTGAPRRLGMPSNVQPARLIHAAHPVVIWGSLLLVWLASLLPWRQQWPGAPDVLLMVIAFWCAHEPQRVGMMTAFVLGLLLDVHDVGLLGGHALAYVLTAYGAVALSRRLLRFELLGQAIHMLPVFVGAQLITQVILAWLNGKWPGWDWATGTLLTVAIWPVVGWALLLPQRPADDESTELY